MDKRHKVLVAERNPNVRELIRRELDCLGFEVVTAKNAREALNLAKTDCEVLVLDHDIPDLGCLGVIRELRRGGVLKPIVVHAFAAEEAKECLSEPATVFEQKSADLGRLGRTVQRLLACIPGQFEGLSAGSGLRV